MDSFDYNHTLDQWLKALGPGARKLINNIRLGLMYNYLHVARLGLELFYEHLQEANHAVEDGVLWVQVPKPEQVPRAHMYSIVDDTQIHAWLCLEDIKGRLERGEGIDRRRLVGYNPAHE